MELEPERKVTEVNSVVARSAATQGCGRVPHPSSRPSLAMGLDRKQGCSKEVSASVQILFGILVAIHALITVGIGAGIISNPRGVAAPGTAWFPVALGQSWLLPIGIAKFSGALWLVAGIGLLATGAAILGLGLPRPAWPTLGLLSALVSLVALALFFHPYYAIAIVVNVAIVAAATVFRSTVKNVLGI
jgi:hypothetical protein